MVPKAAQNAKEEIVERLFGVSINKEEAHTDTLKKDSLVKLPSIPLKADSVKRDTNMVVIPIEIINNETFLTVKLNGIDVRFTLDTGCSDVQLTVAEFYYLKHMGLASEKDLGEKVKCSYANGEEGECHTLNIKSLMIGGLEVKNVRCTVEENIDGPLLLGQSVLQELGEVTIDYNEKVIKVRNGRK